MHVIVLEDNPSRLGGKERSTLDICYSLYQRGHHIHLLYAEKGDLLPDYQKFCDQIIQINRFKISHDQSLTTHVLFRLWNNLVKIYNIPGDIVYINQYHDSLFASALALFKTIPLLCHLRHPPPPTMYKKWRLGLKLVKQFIAISHQTKQDWVNQGFPEKKIAVVYNGIKPTLFTPAENSSIVKNQWGIDQGTKVIAYVGRLDKSKGLETLIRGFSRVLKSGINAILLIAGKPYLEDLHYQNHLERIADKLGIKTAIKFTGHLENPTWVYQISDVTVLPSLDSEPFGRSIIESMACGTPVIGSCTGGIPEILTGEFKVGLFEPGNEQDLSTVLTKLIKWRETDPTLSQRCRNHIVEHFNLDRTVNGVEQIMLNLVNK